MQITITAELVRKLRERLATNHEGLDFELVEAIMWKWLARPSGAQSVEGFQLTSEQARSLE